MGKMNLGRIAVGGLAAGVVMFFGDYLVHSVLLKGFWSEAMAMIGRKAGESDMSGMPYFVAYDLCKGIGAAWLYAAIRPRFGAGIKTALLAGLAVWALTVPIPLGGIIPMQWFGRRMALAWALYEIVPTLVAAVAAGFLYKEGESAAPAPAPAKP